MSGSDDIKKALSTAQSTVRSDILAAKSYRYVIEPYLQAKYSKANILLRKYSDDAVRCYVMETKLNDNIKTAQTYLESLVEAIRGEDEDTYINSLPAFKAGSNNAGENYRKLSDLMYQLEIGVSDQNNPRMSESKYASALKECSDVATALGDLTNSLPKQVDPPYHFCYTR